MAQGTPRDARGSAVPTIRGGQLSRDAIEWLIAKHARAAAERCPTLRDKKSPLTFLRHSCAMSLLRAGVAPP